MADLKPEMIATPAAHTVKTTIESNEMKAALDQHTIVVRAASIQDTMKAPADQHTMSVTVSEEGVEPEGLSYSTLTIPEYETLSILEYETMVI